MGILFTGIIGAPAGLAGAVPCDAETAISKRMTAMAALRIIISSTSQL
jgi:hypothetical protein